MKSLRIYTLLFLYTLSCIGVVIDFHYCGNELASVALYHADEDGCCGDEGEKTCHCCNDKYVSLDTDDTENPKSIIISKNNFVKKIISQYELFLVTLHYGYIVQDKIIPINHAPPNKELASLFLKNSILRI